MENRKKDTRKRNWTFLQYEDSAPSDWLEQLRKLGVPFVVSPLHDKDLNEDGTPKKAHRHIGLAFSGKKSFEEIQEISNLISGVKPEPIRDMRSFVRYLIHLDDPNKAQYQRSDIQAYGGFDVDTYLSATGRDARLILREMLEYIQENQIDSFHEFCDYVMTCKFDEWSETFFNKYTVVVKEYIKSYAWKHKVVDPETGETRWEGNFLRDGKG